VVNMFTTCFNIRTTQHRIPKQRTLYNNSCESFKSFISAFCPQIMCS
jgi:hypothetical protein